MVSDSGHARYTRTWHGLRCIWLRAGLVDARLTDAVRASSTVPTPRQISHSRGRAVGAAHVRPSPPRPRQTDRSPLWLPRETTAVCQSGQAQAGPWKNRGWPGAHRRARGCYASSADATGTADRPRWRPGHPPGSDHQEQNRAYRTPDDTDPAQCSGRAPGARRCPHNEIEFRAKC